MSKSGKGSTAGKLEGLSFEDALQQLEDTVETMESGDLPLEALLSRYEQGMQLAQVCQKKLAEAEVKIQQLERNAKGVLTLKPLMPDSDAESNRE